MGQPCAVTAVSGILNPRNNNNNFLMLQVLLYNLHLRFPKTNLHNSLVLSVCKLPRILSIQLIRNTSALIILHVWWITGQLFLISLKKMKIIHLRLCLNYQLKRLISNRASSLIHISLIKKISTLPFNRFSSVIQCFSKNLCERHLYQPLMSYPVKRLQLLGQYGYSLVDVPYLTLTYHMASQSIALIILFLEYLAIMLIILK